MALNVRNLLASSVAKLRDRVDRDKSMSGFQFAQGGLGNRVNQFLQTPVRVPQPVARVATQFAQATPGRIVSQGVRQNLPYYKQATSGFVGGSTFGLAPRIAPPPSNLGQKAAYGVGFVGGMFNPLNPIIRGASALKAIKPVEQVLRTVQRPLGQYAGGLISKGGLRALAGRGVANVAQGLPYTASYALAKRAIGQKYTPENLATDLGADLAIGSLPMVGAMALGVKGALGKSGISKGILQDFAKQADVKIIEDAINSATVMKNAGIVPSRKLALDIAKAKTPQAVDNLLLKSKSPKLSVEPVGGKDLLSEARKYKSAEEFVNSKPVLYHGTKEDFGVLDASQTQRGVYLTPDKSYARDYTSSITKSGGQKFGPIKEYYLAPDTKVGTNADLSRLGLEDFKKQFDALKQSDNITVLYNSDKALTKSQLTTAFNEAKGGKVGGEVSSPTGIRTGQEMVSDLSGKTELGKPLEGEIPTRTTANKEVSLQPIISKKGKLNLERLAVDDKGKQALQDINQGIPTSVISNKSVIEKAKIATGANKPMSDEQMQNLLAQQLKNRQQVVDLSAKFSKAKADGASEAELGKIMLELANQSRTAQQGGTFAGRLLQAQNIVADKSASPMQKILALLDNAGVKEDKYLKDAVKVNWDDPKQVVGFYRKYVPPQLGEVLTEIRYTNMLSSPLTHIINTASNALMTGVVTPLEKTITGTIDKFRSALTGKERQYYATAGIDYAKGYVKALPDAIKKAWNVLSQKEISIRPDMEYVPTGVGGPLQAYTTPLRALEAMDQFFKTLVQGGVTRELGKGPQKLSVTKIASKAEQEATYRLFRQTFDPKGELGQGVVLQMFDKWNSAINGLRRLPGGKWVLPFLQTPTNILKQGVEYSPLGVTTMVGAKNPVEQLSKTIIGTGVFTAAYQLASSGLTSWEAPSGEKERELYYAAGMQPYSVKMGDKWVSFSKLGPLSYPIAMAAALAHAERNNPDKSKIENVGKSISGMLGFFGDQSYVRSIGELVDAIQGGVNVGASAMSGQAANLAGQLVPYKSFLTWLGRMTDPTYRKAKTFGERMVKDLPILGEGLKPYTSPSGKPSMRDLPIVNAVSPLRISVEKKNEKSLYDIYEQKRVERGVEKRAGDKLLDSGGSGVVGKTYQYVDDKGSLKSIDVGKTVSLPSTSNLQKVEKNKAVYSAVKDVMNSTLKPEEKESALKELGVNRKDAVYYTLATKENDEKYAFIQDVIEKSNPKSSAELIKLLVPMVYEVNGKKILADGVIDDLYDAELISKNDKKYLKSLKAEGTKLTRKRSGGSVKSAITNSELLKGYTKMLEAMYGLDEKKSEKKSKEKLSEYYARRRKSFKLK